MVTEWVTSAVVPPLQTGGVQIWRLDLTLRDTDTTHQKRVRILAPEEQARAARMRDPAARDEFVGGRVLLRKLLGAVLDKDPAEVAFEIGLNGKPKLKGKAEVEFNVSHSHGIILAAISGAGPVGVDIEYLDEGFAGSDEMLEIARGALLEEECQAMEQAHSPAERTLQFYRAWTRREALAKADGRGIAEPLSYEVSSPDQKDTCQVFLVNVGGDGIVGYSVHTLFVKPLYVAALATLQLSGPVAFFEAAALFGRS